MCRLTGAVVSVERLATVINVVSAVPPDNHNRANAETMSPSCRKSVIMALPMAVMVNVIQPALVMVNSAATV